MASPMDVDFDNEERLETDRGTQHAPQLAPRHLDSSQSEFGRNRSFSFVSASSQDRGSDSRSTSRETEQPVQKARHYQRREGKGRATGIRGTANVSIPLRRSMRQSGKPGVASPTEQTQSLMDTLLRNPGQRYHSNSVSSLSEQASGSHSMTSMETERPPPQKRGKKRRRDSNDSTRPSKRPKPSKSGNARPAEEEVMTTMEQDLRLADIPFHYGSRFNGAAVKGARILPFSLAVSTSQLDVAPMSPATSFPPRLKVTPLASIKPFASFDSRSVRFPREEPKAEPSVPTMPKSCVMLLQLLLREHIKTRAIEVDVVNQARKQSATNQTSFQKFFHMVMAPVPNDAIDPSVQQHLASIEPWDATSQLSEVFYEVLRNMVKRSDRRQRRA